MSVTMSDINSYVQRLCRSQAIQVEDHTMDLYVNFNFMHSLRQDFNITYDMIVVQSTICLKLNSMNLDLYYHV